MFENGARDDQVHGFVHFREAVRAHQILNMIDGKTLPGSIGVDHAGQEALLFRAGKPGSEPTDHRFALLVDADQGKPVDTIGFACSFRHQKHCHAGEIPGTILQNYLVS